MFGNVFTLQTAHGNFLMLCQMVLLPNINFLISKQNKTPKIDPNWSSSLVLLLLDILFYTNKQSFGIKYKYSKQIYKYLYFY